MSSQIKEYRSDDGQVLRGKPISLTQYLLTFRRQIEHEAGTPIKDLELNTALLLSDLCRLFGLSEENRCRVLGKQATSFVYSTEAQTVSLKLKLS
jgi:hypothetical protein